MTNDIEEINLVDDLSDSYDTDESGVITLNHGNELDEVPADALDSASQPQEIDFTDHVHLKSLSLDTLYELGYVAHQGVVDQCKAYLDSDDTVKCVCLLIVNDNPSAPPLLVATPESRKKHRQNVQYIRSLGSNFGLKTPLLMDGDEESIIRRLLEVESQNFDVQEAPDDSSSMPDDLTDAKKQFIGIVEEAINIGASDFDISFNLKNSYYVFAIGGKMNPRVPLSPTDAKLMINAMFNTESENMTGSLEDEQIIDKNLNVAVAVTDDNGRPRLEQVRLRAEKTFAHNGYTLSVRVIRTEQSEGFALDELGFEDAQFKLLDYLVKTPTGIILIVGPTGHGKSVTLKAFYEAMDPTWKIVVIEDPVEYIINHPHCTQRPVVPEKNLTVKRHLKSTLRQFPKVIGISEIRDHAVAEDVINISLSGHKMVATMHANDSLAVLTRLKSLGVTYQVQAQDNLFSATMSQRLLPKLCPECKVPSLHDVYGEIFKKKNGGCSRCSGKGYKGVQLVAEIVVIDSTIRRLLNDDNFNAVLPYLKSKGWRSIKDVGISKVKMGLVDPDDLFKSLGDETNNETAEFNYETGSFEQVGEKAGIGE